MLVGGTLFYITAIALAFPYTAILLKGRLGVSVAVVGAIMGLTALGGLPLQPLAGSLSDRFGRRAVMITCAAMEALMYGGLAFAHGFGLICALVFCDRALGWPLFLTASNAMVADLVQPSPAPRRLQSGAPHDRRRRGRRAVGRRGAAGRRFGVAFATCSCGRRRLFCASLPSPWWRCARPGPGGPSRRDERHRGCNRGLRRACTHPESPAERRTRRRKAAARAPQGYGRELC